MAERMGKRWKAAAHEIERDRLPRWVVRGVGGSTG